MKRLVLVGTLATLIGTGAAFAQGGMNNPQGGHAAPKTQPATGPAVSAPEGQIALGSVTLSRAVKADGKDLPAGTYQVRLTAEAPAEAKGASQGLERWAEFVRGGKVVGREVVTIIPQSEIANVQKDTPPGNNSAKVEMLKGGDYMRVWIRRANNHYLLHFAV